MKSKLFAAVVACTLLLTACGVPDDTTGNQGNNEEMLQLLEEVRGEMSRLESELDEARREASQAQQAAQQAQAAAQAQAAQESSSQQVQESPNQQVQPPATQVPQEPAPQAQSPATQVPVAPEISTPDFSLMDVYDHSWVADELRSRSELIPWEGDLGGTPFWVDIAAIPDGELSGAAYASAEDGHNIIYAMYQYRIEGSNVTFSLVAWEYDQ